MLRHIFIGPAFDTSKEQDIDYVVEVLRNLPNIIPQIRSISVEKSLGLFNESKGIVMIATFDNEQDWRAYMNDDRHHAEGEKIKPFIDLSKMTVTQTVVSV
ncbi:Dabb family protein [Exercitatus varius]|uniref:Dabb family protein n=1 Tax=Exercitatus varius TaxID=67857 RepID=UPI00294B27D6|nr:Dabb family protein [Exercitatus varius]MDG2941620.1 Dabb family protein [Exercitatus varius]